MLASGICGTDKHTFRGETQQYAGTDHASSTPFPIIQGHENVGVVAAIGDGGATAFDGIAAAGRRPRRARTEPGVRRMRVLPRRLPVLLLPATRELRQLADVLRSAPHLFGGWAEYLYLRPGTPVFHVPDGLPTNVAVLTELFAVTHSLDLAAKMPRPGGFREGDTVAVVGIGPVGIVHVAKASLMGASRVIAIDPFGPRVALGRRARRNRHVGGQRRRPCRGGIRARPHGGRGVDVVVDATGHPASFGPSLDAAA